MPLPGSRFADAANSRFAGRVAVVSGGADGMGAACVERLAADHFGAEVFARAGIAADSVLYVAHKD